MRNTIISLLSVLATIMLAGCAAAPTDYTSYVDPRIGSGGHGHVFVGANVPFGMVQVGTSAIVQEWDTCSGYNAWDNTVVGITHTHLSGTGCGDLQDICVMPVVGTDLTYARGTADDQSSGLWSYTDRSQEIAEPGYYSVPLERYGVLAEMTATARVGFERYTFPEGAQDAALVFDLVYGFQDRVDDAGLEVVDDTHVVGWRHSSGWSPENKLFFAAEFSKPFTAMTQHGERGLYYRLDFDEPGELLVKVAVSPVCVEGAQDNMAAELPGWDFEAVRKSARTAWNTELSKVKVSPDADIHDLRIFYTALYHTMICPQLFSDAGHPDRYTTFSLWDTYRAMMPLYTVLWPERVNDVMESFLDIYDAEGKLPVWHLWGGETWCMVGNPGVAVMADVVTKGFDGFDLEHAFEAMKVSATNTDRGQGERMQYGYIPSDLANESVAYECEYAVADWALAQAAEKLGKTEDAAYFLERSHSWRRHFDPETGFVRGIMSDGSWREPFNPYHSNHRRDDYTEGNAWQYTWLAPHDLEGMYEVWGSKEAMLKGLDSLFVADSRIEGENASGDISGLIGQYVHGNEPSHHIIYLYSMAGERDKTADLVRRVFEEMYADGLEGLAGNEDAGQMSAWYILSALGMYQAEPACGRFWFGTPRFENTVISLPEGKSFEISAPGVSDSNRYIRSIKLNGEPYDLPYLDYASIMAGGRIEFEMGE